MNSWRSVTSTTHAILNVGCGIGVGPAYIARKYGCGVVGVDISAQMIAWARRRANEAGVADKVDLPIADVLALPFPAATFDIVTCESVLIFVADKRQAIQESVRVTKPGGYVGINKCFWFEEPTPEMAARVTAAIGPAIPTLADWQALGQPQAFRSESCRQIDARAEFRGQVQWIGWPWLLRAWARALRLIVTQPGIRLLAKQQFAVSAKMPENLGYGLMVGRK